MLQWFRNWKTRSKESGKTPIPLKQTHMTLLRPSVSPLNIDSWCRFENKLLQLDALAFREDFDLDKLPSAWTSCRTLDSDDVRIKIIDERSLVFAFSFGVLLFVNHTPAAQESELLELQRHYQTSFDARVSSDRFTLRVDVNEKPRVEYNGVVIDNLTPERMGVFVEALAQSVAMEYYESVIMEAKQKTLDLLGGLKRKGGVSFSPRKINRSIADVMLMHAEVVGTLHLLDKPDIIWNDSVMDALYTDLRAAFDLEERFKSIQYKIDIIRESLNIIVDTARDARSYRVDFAILAFVGFEVVFTFLNHYQILPR